MSEMKIAQLFISPYNAVLGLGVRDFDIFGKFIQFMGV